MREHEEELHPVAVALTRELTIPEDAPGEAVFSHAALAEARRTLRENAGQPYLFISLCIISARLAQGPLKRAAAQFAELARIGLSNTEVQRHIDEAAVREALDLVQPGTKAVAGEGAFVGESKVTLDAVAKQVAIAKPTERAAMLRSLASAAQRRAAFEALKRVKPRALSLVDVVKDIEPQVREDIITQYAELAAPMERERLVRVLGTEACDEMSLLFLLQFSPPKEAPTLIAAALATGRSRARLQEMADGVRLRDGRVLAELI